MRHLPKVISLLRVFQTGCVSDANGEYCIPGRNHGGRYNFGYVSLCNSSLHNAHVAVFTQRSEHACTSLPSSNLADVGANLRRPISTAASKCGPARRDGPWPSSLQSFLEPGVCRGPRRAPSFVPIPPPPLLLATRGICFLPSLRRARAGCRRRGRCLALIAASALEVRSWDTGNYVVRSVDRTQYKDYLTPAHTLPMRIS